MLNELNYYIHNIKNQSQITLKNNHPKMWSIISFIASALASFAKSPILLGGLLIIFFFILIFKDLFDMIFSKDYAQLSDSTLLSCIEERRLEIIKSSQKNIITRIKYALKLGEYQ